MPLRLISMLYFIAALGTSNGQQLDKSSTYSDASFGAGGYRGSFSLSYFKNWQAGKNQKLGAGFGLRYTGFLGANQYYVTAPAILTSESSSPLIIFKENIVRNMDSLLVKSPQVNALNLFINIDYQLTSKVILGFNIDAIGFSFGAKQRGNYINGAEGKNTQGRPTNFNILLISDNDRGTLNSELYIRYLLNPKFAIKGGAQFLFTEYTTIAKVQQFPKENDRFRNKSLLFSAGITYKLSH